jgi:O-antigen ligase
MIKSSPFFGIGEGNFVWRLAEHQGSLRAANLIYKLDVPETEILQNTVPDWLFQPVHNIYLLIASENGIFAALFFLAFLAMIFYPAIDSLRNGEVIFILYLMFLSFCIISLTDHFFWTLQQGRLMFWLAAGILSGLRMRS